MTETITLPQLIGSREAANELVSGVGDVSGATVVVDCRRLVSGSQSFADELVVRLIQDKRAAQVDIVEPYDDFWEFVSDSARDIGAQDQVHRVSSGRLLSL